jgi:hypothetical protein
VSFSRGLKTRDLQTAKIILNLTDAKIERNTWQDGKTFPELFSYFYQAYPKYLEPIMQELGYQVESSEPITQAPVLVDAEVAEVKELTSDEPTV